MIKKIFKGIVFLLLVLIIAAVAVPYFFKDKIADYFPQKMMMDIK